MANFDQTQIKRTNLIRAGTLLDRIRTVYTSAKLVQAELDVYTSGSDPAFNTAINTLFSSSERAEISAMLTQLVALITEWETNHSAVLGIQQP